METNWRAIGQAFRDIGMGLGARCDSLEMTCEEDPEFERMYLWYVMMLDVLKMWRKWIDAQFDVIDVGYTDMVI